jgi:ferredoxin--NADP+ reductase
MSGIGYIRGRLPSGPVAALCRGEQGILFHAPTMTISKPLRVAIVGAGPAGMYSAEHLLEKRGLNVEIDIYERLVTPWGLVRSGVAPDHPEKKMVIERLFDYILSNRRVRYIGNVEVGEDILHAEFITWYDAVIYAVGADGDTRMGIAGEDLSGCWSAREFVSYYNGHPDFSDLRFDLSTERAVVVGNGNVALDVARMLTMSVDELAQTDIADAALSVLRDSRIREVMILGRRSHLQGAFHNPELEELEHVRGVDVFVANDDFSDEHALSLAGADWQTQRKVTTLNRLTARRRTASNRRIVFRFLSSPVELLGDDKVERIRVVSNRMDSDRHGNPIARATDHEATLECGLVLRAIGYKGTPFPELPFDDRRGVIPNMQGRIADEGYGRPGVYVTGWIKRGCRGIIGSNKKCARESVDCLLEDYADGRLVASSVDRDQVLVMAKQKKPDLILRPGWQAVDRAERESGRNRARPRVKITDAVRLLACAHAVE